MRLGGLQKFSLSDFPGVPAAIIFTQGCNFRCPFCHNGELLSLCGKGELDVAQVFDWLKSRASKLEGVVITGGEPCLHNDLADFLTKIKNLGFKVKLDTNGSFPEKLAQIIEAQLVDFIAMDVKADWNNYDTLCGVNVRHKDITRSIEIIAKSGVPHLFRTTFVPALMNDTETVEIQKILPGKSQYIVQKFRSETAFDPQLR